MKTIKVKNWREIPNDYTGIIESISGDFYWFKNGKWHREDGPAKIWSNGYKFWYLDDYCVWSSYLKAVDFINKIILSKDSHPLYPTVQVWRYIDKNGIQEQIIIPGMEKFIIL